MNVLCHFKRHYNIETKTVVRLAVKLMRVAYGEFYNWFYTVIWSLLCCTQDYQSFLNWSHSKFWNPFRSHQE